MGLRIVQVDAFTDKPFRGNPAAVCVLPEPRDETWMQDVAREMNLSETAFLVPRGGDEGAFDLRWFTPVVEVALCGHATLASAHALWESGRLRPDQQARFFTKSGLLLADKLEGGFIELDFPEKPEEQAPEPEGLVRALGAPVHYIGKNVFDYIVLLESEEVVRGIKPDMSMLARLPVRGVVVTSRASTPGFDFISRFFAPASGVDEDPVTGSAHCCLAPFWAKRLDKAEMLAYQASARGGVVRVKCGGGRVKLGGQAVTVLEGELKF
jgi:PhzF family phenazine biosynthesis protein